MKTKTQNFDQEYLNSLNIALCNNFDSICEYFDIETQSFRNYRSTCCPIHLGDNPTGLTIYPENEPYGYWQCNTNYCHKHFPRNLIGFIWGVMSSKGGWTKENNLKVNFKDVLELCKGLVGHVKVEKVSYRAKIASEAKEEVIDNIGRPTREEIRKKMIIPADYFLKQGYKKETLNHFDIGEFINPDGEMANRIIVPIYDENFFYVGCQGRHKDDTVKLRWKNCDGLKVESILYNYHAAKPLVRESKTIILVESPKSVWRLWEAGIRNVVAILGNFKSGQKILLETSGANRILCMMDNDIPGEEHFESIKSKCKRLFNIEQVRYKAKRDGNDPANLSIEEVKNVFSTIR
jgi:hypothetical protein